MHQVLYTYSGFFDCCLNTEVLCFCYGLCESPVTKLHQLTLQIPLHCPPPAPLGGAPCGSKPHTTIPQDTSLHKTLSHVVAGISKE